MCLWSVTSCWKDVLARVGQLTADTKDGATGLDLTDGKQDSMLKAAEPVDPQAGFTSVQLDFGLSCTMLVSVRHGGEHVDDASQCFDTDSTGLRPWWGGLLLASWISHEPQQSFAGHRTIELGCGAFPLPSIAACMSGAAITLATDGCERKVLAAKSVFESNGRSCQECHAQRLSWEDGAAQSGACSWDVVLFADVLYNQGSSPILARIIASLVRSRGVVFGAVGLHRSGSSEIFADMQREGFVAQEIPINGLVMAAAKKAAVNLNRATMFDVVASSVESTSLKSNECILVRWVKSAANAQVGSDMSSFLGEKVLHAPYANEDAAETLDWMPTE